MNTIIKWFMRGSLFAFGVVSLMYVFTITKKQPPATDGTKEAVILHTVMQVLDQAHFRPQSIDDQFSKAVYDEYLDAVDGSKRFFTQNDIDQLKVYETRLDEDVKARNLDFHYLMVKLIKASVLKAEGYYKDAMARTYDFKSDKTIELDPDKLAYAKSDAALKTYWNTLIEYEIESRLADRLEEQLKSTDKAKRSTADLEKEVQAKVKEVYDDYFFRLKNSESGVWFEAYLNAITGYFDPHSNYFSPKDKEDFNMQMSGKYEGIGARLMQDKEYVKVSNIILGGPAARNKELEVDDLLLSVTQDGGQAKEVVGMRVDEVITYIRGKKGTGVTINVKKKDGNTKAIHLIRDEVILEEGYAKASIIEIPGTTDKIGYILLPNFYADFEDNNGKSCARDIAKETSKLQKAGVKGIIIDLRYNGGGSLTEVVDMAGQFIETGPVVQVKSKSGNPYVMNDRDNSVNYDGPLLIMTNAYSASASEILAAALQDYKRAVIVGSPSTYGKGTVQRFFPLDKMVSGVDQYKPLGEIKVSVQKFYRINGGSTQLRGVVPDIVLADNFKYLEVGEKESKHAMEWTEISKLNYSQNVYVVDNIDQLRAASAARTDTSTIFKLLDENALRLKNRGDMTIASLNLDKLMKEEKIRENESEKFTLLNNRTTKLVPTPSADFSAIDKSNTSESVLQERQEEWFRSIRKDIYLEECAQIVQDMIRTSNIKVAKSKN
ncbi:MAG: carboxy terminal-processing peptidase [Saprospiraceae bacterium]